MQRDIQIKCWLTTREAAAHIGKPVSWLHNNAAQLHIPRFKIGQQYRYSVSDLDGWLTSKREM